MSDITLELTGGPVEAYLAIPNLEGPLPGLLVLCEAWGLNDDIRRITDRFADEGYVALAPDFVDGGQMRCLAKAFRDLRRGGGPVLDLVDEALDELAAQPLVDSDRLAVAGFCLGGGFAFLLGLGDKVSAIAPNYGEPPRDLDRMVASCPAVVSYGGKDRMFRKYSDRVEKVLAANNVAHDVKTYPDAGHSFLSRDDGHRLAKALMKPFAAIGFHQESAEDAWDRITAFFEKHV